MGMLELEVGVVLGLEVAVGGANEGALMVELKQVGGATEGALMMELK